MGRYEYFDKCESPKALREEITEFVTDREKFMGRYNIPRSPTWGMDTLKGLLDLGPGGDNWANSDQYKDLGSEVYQAAWMRATDFRKTDRRLSKPPDHVADPETGLYQIIQWCIEAEWAPTPAPVTVPTNSTMTVASAGTPAGKVEPGVRLMGRDKVATVVQEHKPFFRERWQEFCRWVEDCAGQLDRYQREQQTEASTRPANSTREGHGTNKEPPEEGWVKWAKYDLEIPAFHVTHLRLTPWCIFYAPAHIVNPVHWILGRKNPRRMKEDSDEQLLVDSALLTAVHDIVLTNRSPIYERGTYQGQYFDVDAFCEEVRDGLGAMEANGALLRAWEYVRPFLEKAENTTPETQCMVFSDDYHKATCGSLKMKFNDHQATIMKILAEGKPVAELSLGAAIDSYAKSYRLLDSFRVHGKYHDAWKYIKKVSKGIYRLNVPAKLAQP